MQSQKRKGAIAQLVEQRTENPCVPGSIPGGTTLLEKSQLIISQLIFLFTEHNYPNKKFRQFYNSFFGNFLRSNQKEEPLTRYY